jgi:hypothetical protein
MLCASLDAPRVRPATGSAVGADQVLDLGELGRALTPRWPLARWKRPPSPPLPPTQETAPAAASESRRGFCGLAVSVEQIQID